MRILLSALINLGVLILTLICLIFGILPISQLQIQLIFQEIDNSEIHYHKN